MAAVNPPRGMRDFLPADKAHRERVLSTIRERYRAHGFDEIETPVVEEYARLHSGIGGDNEKLSYSILRRGLDADAIRAAADKQADLSDLGLRYDLTVPLTRFYASHRADLPPVFRAVQIAPVWRAERPQKGRFRQFLQADIDVIGDATPRAETELIVATVDTLARLGLSGVSVRVNDRRLLDALLDSFGFAESDRPGVLITIDKLDKVGVSGVVAELRSSEIDEQAIARLQQVLEAAAGADIPLEASAIASALPQGIAPDVIADLAVISDAVASGLGDNTIPLMFDPFLVRGMGYYTGTIFEIAHPDVSYSLGGGGRYDGMVGRFLGQDVPAVGFSLGFERIVDLLERTPAGAEQAIVLIHDRDVEPGALAALKTHLIGEGFRVRLEQRTKNTRAILDRAERDEYRQFAFVTSDTDTAALELRSIGD